MEEESGPLYSRADMLAAAARQLGRPVSYRMLVDWVELGLVPAPNCIYPGWGKGRRGLWTATGFNLWGIQLRNRQRHSIGTMCNLPVGVWVYRDALGIEMPQVRRALNTWAARARRGRKSDLAKNARILMGRIAHPGASRKTREALVRLLENRPWRGTASRQRLHDAIVDVVSPGLSGGSGEPLTAKWMADRVEHALIAKWLGVQSLPVGPRDGSRDPVLGRAKDLLRNGALAYKEDQPRWSKRAPYARLFETVELDRLIGGACGDLALMMGIIRLAGRKNAEPT
jgi:hypothetical protein